MERKVVTLKFSDNVYHELNCELIEFEKGIYIAYSGQFDGTHVDLNTLLYIGMSDDTSIKNRIRTHAEAHHNNWLEDQNEKGKNVFYKVAHIDNDIRNIEANLIFRVKPPCNGQDIVNYNGTRPAPTIITNLNDLNTDKLELVNNDNEIIIINGINGNITDILSLMP